MKISRFDFEAIWDKNNQITCKREVHSGSYSVHGVHDLSSNLTIFLSVDNGRKRKRKVWNVEEV